MIRNISQIYVKYEILETAGRFRLIQFERPYWEGYEFWILNEKGFLWEPAVSLDAALAYLESDEAREYNASPGQA